MNARRMLTAIMVVAVLGTSVARAQTLPNTFRQYDNYDRYQYLPRLPEGPENPQPFPNDPKDAEGSTEILVDALRGIIILDTPDAVVSQPGEVDGLQVHATSAMLNSPAIHHIANKYLGQPISIRSLNELAREIIIFYRKHDQPVVDVAIPANQEITDGVVQFVVNEARIGKVRVEGACYFDNCRLLDQLCLSTGSPIYESALLREQRWLYRNPFRIVDLELEPGDQRGETDVIFHVKDKLPWRVYAGYEDTGNRSTGLERTLYGVNWFNAFGRDDQAGYQLTGSSDFNQFLAHSAFYSSALPNRDILTAYVSYAEFQAPLPGFLFANQGSIGQFMLRWYRELCPRCNYEHGITAGYDFKRIDTELSFFGVPVLTSSADISQFMFGYHGKQFNACDAWLVGIDAYWSPGGMSSRNNNANFNQVRPFATADYFYTRGYAERRRYLASNLELMSRVTGQLGEGNLLPTEQLGVGGYNSVRGYDINSAIGDSGMFTTLELRTRPMQPGVGCRYGMQDCFGMLQDQLSTHVFYDFGVAYKHTALPQEARRANLHGVGTGFRYSLQRRLTLRMDYGWALTAVNAPGQPRQPRHRVHIGTVLSC